MGKEQGVVPEPALSLAERQLAWKNMMEVYCSPLGCHWTDMEEAASLYSL